MKLINNYISEKLKLNKNFKVKHNIISIKGETNFSENELNIIADVFDNVDAIPEAITNQCYVSHKLLSFSTRLFIFYNKDWKTNKINYSYIQIIRQDQNTLFAQIVDHRLRPYELDSKYLGNNFEEAIYKIMDKCKDINFFEYNIKGYS